MSLIRQDPTTKEWVILAAQRGKRPHDFKKAKAEREIPQFEPTCPFCPGNEVMTPPEVFRSSDPSKGSWAVRVTANKFAALQGEGEPTRRESDSFFREMDGVGYHEVIIETPLHDHFLPLMTESEVEDLLRVYQARYQALREKPWIRSILIFKNHGEHAGTSLEHPHSQLVAMPVTPMLIRRKYEVAITHFDDTGRCLYCDVVEAEGKAKVRLILETDRFLVFHPFACHVPFETWIVPKHHQPSFGRILSEEIIDLAKVLRKTLKGLYQALGNPDFNLIVHSAPPEDENKMYYLWHIQILPRVTTIAGFELGSGIFITTMEPETSAPFMRQVLKDIDS